MLAQLQIFYFHFAKMLPAATAPAFGGKGPSSLNYAQQPRLWRQVTNLGPSTRASTLIPQMDVAARQVCKAAKSDAAMGGDGADPILTISRKYFTPDAVDSVY